MQRHLRILLADDSEDNRFLVRGYLKDSNCVLDEAENGLIAVEKFKGQAYDLVLTDVEMPVLDGYSAVREMRSYEKERGSLPTPIIALTAHALEQARARSIESGCTGHLVKPIRKSALLEAIGRYAGGAKRTGFVEASVEPWLKPIVSGYLEKRRCDVVSLRAAIGRGDFQTVRTIGHQMAGTGASYGFPPVTEIGFRLEEAALVGDAGQIAVNLEELERYLQSLVVS
jgi:CheY-like chemotaxis protein